MNGRDFLILAEDLLNLKTEAAWRSAISRAYYAAFHAARELMESLGFVVPNADRAHGYLWLRLQNSGDSGVEGAGRDLKMLRRFRNEADYELRYSVSAPKAATRLRLVDTILLSLDAAMNEPTRTQIMDTMKRYERNVLRDVTWHP